MISVHPAQILNNEILFSPRNTNIRLKLIKVGRITPVLDRKDLCLATQFPERLLVGIGQMRVEDSCHSCDIRIQEEVLVSRVNDLDPEPSEDRLGTY